MPNLSRVSELLLEWEAAWQGGVDISAEELCRDSPGELTELTRAISLLREFDARFSLNSYDKSVPAEPSPQPQLVGYRILNELGRGGMGIVYRAWQEELAREVAIKVMHQGTGARPQAARRFVQEARLLANLTHDNLVRVYEANLFRGRPYFVMELVEGGNLAQSRSKFSSDPKGAVALVALIARAIHHAHEQSVLHRDLKPANILLDRQGRPHVTDFGIAKLLHVTAVKSSGPPQFRAGHDIGPSNSAPFGTPPYMAPEQFGATWEPITSAADIWALGVILYELLTGHRPFSGGGPFGYRVSICESTPLLPRTLNSAIDRRLEAVVLKCLSKSPCDRYNTAADLADDLDRWVRGESLEALPDTWLHQVLSRARRQSISTTILVLLSTVLTMGLVAYALFYAFSDPDVPIRDIETKLAHGEKVTLLGETGEPAWYHKRMGANHTQTFMSPDGVFSVQSWDVGLVELLRDPQNKNYIIRVQIQQQLCEEAGEVGIYFGHYSYPSRDDVSVNALLYVAFNDIIDAKDKFSVLKVLKDPPPLPSRNQVYFNAHLFAQKDGTLLVDDHMVTISPPMFTAAGFHGRIWRTLTIVVRADCAEGIWGDSQPIGSLPIKQLATRTDVNLDKHNLRLSKALPFDTLFPSYPQRGAIGLFVRHCRAMFRSITVEPLAD